MDKDNQDKKQSSSIDKTFIDNVYQEILKQIKALTPEQIAGAPQTSIKATLLVLIDDLRRFNQVTTSLNTRLLWLTVILVILTCVQVVMLLK